MAPPGFGRREGRSAGCLGRRDRKREKSDERERRRKIEPNEKSFFFPDGPFESLFFSSLSFPSFDHTRALSKIKLCSPCLERAYSPRRLGLLLMLQERKGQQQLLLLALLSSRPLWPRPRRRPGLVLPLVAADKNAPPPSHRRRRHATVRFLG